jgi:hypothetical protein
LSSIRSGFGIGVSAAETVVIGVRASAVNAMDDRANALRVMGFGFILFVVCFA